MTKLKSVKTPEDIFNKTPPHSPEAESAVLGSCILENAKIDSVSEIINPGDFYELRNAIIFKTILELHNSGNPVDLLTLPAELNRTEKMEKVGGIAYVSSLTDLTPMSSRAETYAKIVYQKSLLRSAILAVSEIIIKAYENPEDVEGFLDESESLFFNINTRKIKPSFYTLKNLTVETLSQIDIASKQNGLTGITTGFVDLDKKTGGLQNTDLIIIAGRPGMGKTALALNIIRNAAIETEKAVAVFSLEMSRWQVTKRLFCAEAKIDSNNLAHGFLAKDDWPKLYLAAERLKNLPIYIDDTPALDIVELRAKARRLVATHDVSLIAVDYLQLMRNQQITEKREREISSISQSLKALAKELNIPVVALSQLNREVENRVGKKPQLSDLRESGAIEQDADLIMFLYRDKKYNPDSVVGDKAELHIAKQRNGPEGVINLTFLEQYAKFENFGF